MKRLQAAVCCSPIGSFKAGRPTSLNVRSTPSLTMQLWHSAALLDVSLFDDSSPAYECQQHGFLFRLHCASMANTAN